MPQVMVQYKVKPGKAVENTDLIKDVYKALFIVEPDGVCRYETYCLDDGVSFVHIGEVEAVDGANPLTDLAEFKEFSNNMQSRCEQAPVFTELTTVGRYLAR